MILPRLFLGLFLLLLVSCGDKAEADQTANYAALSIPQLTGRVVDQADLLDADTEKRVSEQLEQLERRTTDQFVIVTLASLDGDRIEDVGLRLGNGWRIGQKGKDNGALLIVAPNDRKVRIEVGRGLEHVLTNELCQEIIDQQILPQFQAGAMREGILAGVDAVTDLLVKRERAATLKEAA